MNLGTSRLKLDVRSSRIRASATTMCGPTSSLAIACVFAVLAWLFSAVPVGASSILMNGGFEAGFLGWTVVNEVGSFPGSNWFTQSGTTSPISGFAVPMPPEGTHAAMTDQGGPGSHLLYQDFVVPFGLTNATLTYDQFIGNRDGNFFTPSSLDFNVVPNQQARTDIITTTANPFSVSAADVLASIFQTHSGDPLVSGYSLETVDLTALFLAHEGQTLRLRFAEVDNQLFFQSGIDNVILDVTAVPEPVSLSLLGLGVTGLWAQRRHRPRRGSSSG